MAQSRLHENPVRIDWDGLGLFQPLNVPPLFPRVMGILARAHRVNATRRTELLVFVWIENDIPQAAQVAWQRDALTAAEPLDKVVAVKYRRIPLLAQLSPKTGGAL